MIVVLPLKLTFSLDNCNLLMVQSFIVNNEGNVHVDATI